MSETRTPLCDALKKTPEAIKELTAQDAILLAADYAVLANSLERRAAHFEALREALRFLVEQVESLEGYDLTPDIEKYQAQANFDDALSMAGKALAAADEIGASDE